MEQMSKKQMHEQLHQAVINTGGRVVTKNAKPPRTSSGLRDMLFDELDELRGGDGNPQKALAVANIAKQIMSTVRVEMEYYRLSEMTDAASPPELGQLKLGSVADAKEIATGR